MGIDVKDLPPAYQEQALRKLMEREALQKLAEHNRERRRVAIPSPATDAPQKDSKYHNKPTERVTASGAVLHFDSQKEARRYDELMIMLQAGKIRDLRLQVDFTLQEAYTDSAGKRVRAIRYKADFTYKRPPVWKITEHDPVGEADRLGVPWLLVVVDVKSRATRTKEYIMKRKMMKDHFGIEIQEV